MHHTKKGKKFQKNFKKLQNDVTIHNTEQDFLMFKYMINIIRYDSMY
jgi:hypothetical protein